VEGDERGFRVALVTGELLNTPHRGLAASAVLAEEDWRVVPARPGDRRGLAGLPAHRR
jgi:hypothetical protein